MTGENNTPVGAAEKSLRIVEGLLELEGGTTTEIASHLDMTKSTVFNHLQTLLENEYIVKDGNEYDVGLKFLRIGEEARERQLVSEVGSPEIDKLAEQTNELANLVVEEHGEAVFLYRSRGSEAVHMDTHTGKRVPLHTTAFGKVILAYLPDEQIDEIIERRGLPAHTENTITDRDEFYSELEKIREQGYAFDREERLKGLCCIAAPIVGGETVIGAVSVSGPKDRLRGERLNKELPDIVSTSANVIELNVTYR